MCHKSVKLSMGVILGIEVTTTRFQDVVGLPWLRDRFVIWVTKNAS